MSGVRISLFSLLDHYPGSAPDMGDRLREAVARAVLAEKLGFDGVWHAEHHFAPFGALPNPAVLLAAIAVRTCRIRLGPAVAVLPFRHPLQVAEDYLIVDQLSGGRLDLGVGSGTLPGEFDGFGLDIASKAERFAEALAVLRPLLTGRTAHLDGRDARIRGVGSNVPPAAPSGPPLFVASNRLEGAEQAGRGGDRLLTLVSPSTGSLTELDDRLAAYRRGREAGGHGPGEVVVAIQAHIAETDEAARAAARAALARFHTTHGGLSAAESARVFEAMVERGTGLFGAPGTVAAGLAGLAERGVRRIALWVGLGGTDAAEVDRGLELLAGRVQPLTARVDVG